jgi:hypothetical protein
MTAALKATRGTAMRTTMMDQCVRLAMSIVVIAMISASLYKFSSHATTVGPYAIGVIGYRH